LSKLDKSKPVNVLFRRGELTRFALIRPISWSCTCQESLWNCRVCHLWKIFLCLYSLTFWRVDFRKWLKSFILNQYSWQKSRGGFTMWDLLHQSTGDPQNTHKLFILSDPCLWISCW
jgi:hypothetical protein